jgi:hypothetical protein
MHTEVLAIIWNQIWHLTVAVTDGRCVGHIWPILPFICLHFIFLATTLALKALKSAQKSVVYILSNILLKWTKDCVWRRQVFVGAVTWSEIKRLIWKSMIWLFIFYVYVLYFIMWFAMEQDVHTLALMGCVFSLLPCLKLPCLKPLCLICIIRSTERNKWPLCHQTFSFLVLRAFLCIIFW